MSADSMWRKEYHLSTRFNESEARKLKVGDKVYLTGELVTMRDMAHLRALELLKSGKKLPFHLDGGVIYHCGPLVKDSHVVSAGPTTSMRMERSEAELINRSGLRGIVGKGGMGEGTRLALMKYGAVYMEYPGGVGALAAKAISGVKDSFWRDMGDPEAVWVMSVEDFGPCFVTMDSEGKDFRHPPRRKKI